MRDITKKKVVSREATATGRIVLQKSTIKAIKNRAVEKGPVLETAKIAAQLAVKQTPLLQPHCHNIPIGSVQTSFLIKSDCIHVSVLVKSNYSSGVEMEAISGVQNALLAIWDMVKGLEKDKIGNYPSTAIKDVSVLTKLKGE